MRSLPPGRDRDEMMQGPAVEGQQNQARSGALLRLSIDFGPQLISESVFGMAPGMNRRGLRRAKLILHQMRRRARLKYNLHVCLRQIDTSADESRKWNQCSSCFL